MAELGVISSIIGIACIGVQLSKHLYHFGSNTANADHNINRIATNITLFSSMLKHVAAVMSDTKSLHTPEAVETAQQIVRECEVVFEEIGKIISVGTGTGETEKGGASGVAGMKRRLSVKVRVKWYFEQPKVDWLLAQLEYLKTTLSVLIQTLHLAAVAAKLDEQNKSIQEHREQINQERLHIETLIFARQLSIIILNQQQQQHPSAAENHSGTKATGRVSPVDSEMSMDVQKPKPKLLTQESDSSLTLVTRGHGHLDFLDNAIPNDEEQFSPTTTRLHDQVIEQLLNRWTRLPELTMTPYNKQKREKAVNTEERAQVDSSEDSTITSATIRDVSPVKKGSGTSDTKPHLPPLSETDASDVTVVASSPKLSEQLKSTLLGPPTNASVPRGTNRTPSPRVRRLSQGSSAPSFTGDNIYNPQANSKAYLLRSASIPETLGPFELASPTGAELEVLSAGSRPAPRPPSVVNAGMKSTSYPPPKPPIASHDTNYPLEASTEGRANQSRPLPQVLSSHKVPQQFTQQSSQPPKSPYQARVSPASSTRSSFSEDDTLIPWRIRIGGKYWDFIDSNLDRSRNPDIPPESLSWLFSNDHAHTEITDTWVSEEALMEQRYLYNRVQDPEEPKPSDTVRWRILRPLNFEAIRALVQRTNRLEHMKMQQRPQAGPVQSQRGRSNSDIRQYPSQPPPQPQSSYFSNNYPPPPPPQQPQSYQENNTPRPTSNFSQWPQQPQYQANNQPGNMQQRPQPPQQQRAVSFGGVNEIPAQQQIPRGGILKQTSTDRSPRTSQDLGKQSYPPQQQQQQAAYWMNQGAPVMSPGQIQYAPPGAPQYPPYTPTQPPQWTYPPPTSQPLNPNYPPLHPQQQQHFNTQQQAQPRPNINRSSLDRSDSFSTNNNSRRSNNRSPSPGSDDSSDSSESSRERQRERRKREKRHEKEKKKRGRAGAAAAGTLGGIGGLAALLEGLDGL